MKRLQTPPGAEVTIDLDGETLPAHEGENLACALLANDERVFSRSIKYHRPRGPYCMAAACTHCLMRVDGVPNVYTCKTPVKGGMRVEAQNAYPTAKVDIFESINFLFPGGLDHHEMFAGVPVAENVMAKVARHLAGLGMLPKTPAPDRVPAEALRTKVAIAGGGAAGIAAAETLAAKGVPFLLLEREESLGGRWQSGPFEDGAPTPQLPPAQLRTRCAVIGLYDDAEGKFFAAVQYGAGGPRLLRVRAERFIVACGGHPAVFPFANNDLPGVFAARAVTQLIRRHHLLPGEAFALLGTGSELTGTAKVISDAGGEVKAMIEVRDPHAKGDAVPGTPLKAHGRHRVSGLSFKRDNGRTKKIACDTIVVCMPPSPSFELARQGGARVNFSETDQLFVVEADADGRTHARDVFAVGELVAPGTATSAAATGRRAAEAVAAEVA